METKPGLQKAVLMFKFILFECEATRTQSGCLKAFLILPNMEEKETAEHQIMLTAISEDNLTSEILKWVLDTLAPAYYKTRIVKLEKDRENLKTEIESYKSWIWHLGRSGRAGLDQSSVHQSSLGQLSRGTR